MLPKAKDRIEQVIIRILATRLRDEERVRDAFQQVQVKLLTMPGATEETRYRVARNIARAMRRQETKLRTKLLTLTSADGSEHELTDGSPNPEEALMDPEAEVYAYALLIDRLLPQLNERQRRFLMLACEGFKMDELQELLGLGQAMTYAVRANVIKKAQSIDLEPDPDPEPGAPSGAGKSRRRKPSGSALAAAVAITKWSRLGALLDALLTLPAFADCTPSDATGLSTQALALTELLLQHSSTALALTSRCADAVVAGTSGLLGALRSLPAFRRKGAVPRETTHSGRVH